MNSYKFYIIFFLANSVLAVKYWEGFSGITTPTLSNTLAKANQAYNRKQYRKAEDFIDKALTMTNAPEFKTVDETNGPLSLQLKASKIYYKGLPVSYLQGNPQIIKLAYAYLDEYSEEANGKRWQAYASLYRRLIDYYLIKDKKKVKKEMKNLLEYMPNKIHEYIFWGLQLEMPLSEVNEKVAAFEKQGGGIISEVNFLIIKHRICAGSNVVEDIHAHFKKYSDTLNADNIKFAFDYFNQNLDLSDFRKIKEYQNLLTWLAVNLPAEKKSGRTIARILNEKRKVVIRISKCGKM